MYDCELTEKYIRQKDFKELDDYIEGMHEQITEKDSVYYHRFNYFAGAMQDIFERAIQFDHEQPSQEMKKWIGDSLSLYMRDVDDGNLAKLFLVEGLSPEEKINRFKAYYTQSSSPIVRFKDCSLKYGSHTAVNKCVEIPTHDTFSVLQRLGSAISKLHQAQFNKFNNFALAILRVVVRDKSPTSRQYYQFIDIPIKDPANAFSNLSNYTSERDITSISRRLRSSKIAKTIDARYQAGVTLAEQKDHAFSEHKPSGQVLLDAVTNSDYEHEYHHSELALFQYLESDACILMLVNYLKNNSLQQNDKVYAAVLDIYSTQQYCQNCEISSLGLQAKYQDRFFAKFQKALLDSGFRVPMKTRTKYGVIARGDADFMKEKTPGIKTAVRCVANKEYDDQRRKKRPHSEISILVANEKEFVAPMQKNLKTETPLSLIKIERPIVTRDYQHVSYGDVEKFTFFSSSQILSGEKAEFQASLKATLVGRR